MKSFIIFTIFTLCIINVNALSIKPIPRKIVDIRTKDTSNTKEKELCEVCQYVANYLKTALSDEDVRKMIINFVEDACVQIPQPIRELCYYFVDHEVAKVIETIEQKSEVELCTEAGVC